MAFEILEMVATLGMAGTRKARAEMKSTERSANSLADALRAVDRAADGWNKVERGLASIRDAIMQTRAAAAKPIVVKVELEGDREVIQRLQTLRKLLGSLGNNSPPVKVDANTRPALGKLRFLSDRLDQLSRGRYAASVDADTDDAKVTVERFLSWVREQSANITVGADTQDAQQSAETVKTYIDSLDASIDVRAHIKAALAALEFVRQRAGRITGTVEVDADTTDALAKIRTVAEAASGIKVEVEVGANTSEAVRGITVVRSLAGQLNGQDATVNARAENSQALSGLSSVLGLGNQVSAYQPNMIAQADVSRALLALIGIRVYGRKVSDEGVQINVSTSGTPITQTQLDAVRAKATELGAKRATVRVNEDGSIKTVFSMQAVGAAADNLDRRRVTINVDAQISKTIPVVLGDAWAQLSRLQSVAAIVSAVAMPTMITALAGASAAALALAGAVASLAIGLGQGLVGAAGAAAGALALGGAGLFAYAQALRSTIGLARSHVGAVADQRYAVEDATKAVDEAKAALAEAAPGTRAHADATNYLALAEQQLANEQNKMNALMRASSPELVGLSASLGKAEVASIGLGAAIAQKTAPALSTFVDTGVQRMGQMQPFMLAMVSAMNRVGLSFLDAAQKGQNMDSIKTILFGIMNAGPQAFSLLTNAVLVFVNVFAPLVGYSVDLLRYLNEMSAAAARWSASGEGQQAIASTWAMLVQRGQQLWTVIKNLAVSAAGLYTALNDSGTVDRMLIGLVNLTGQFREMLGVGGQWRAAITEGMINAQPILTSVFGLVKEIATQFFRVAGAVLDVGANTGNVSKLVDIFDALTVSVEPLATLLIDEFEHFAPLLPPLIENVAKLMQVFLESTPMLLGFVDVMNVLLTAFTGLSPETQRTVASIASFATLLASTGTPALVGNAAQMGTNIALLNAMKANTAALTGVENVSLITRARNTAALVANKIALAASTVATKAYTAGQWLLNAAMTANPIGLVVVAIAALVAGLILAYRHSETFRNIVNSVFGFLKTTATVVVKGLQIAIEAAWNWIKTNTPIAWNAVKTAITVAWNAVKATIQAGITFARENIAAGWNFVKNTTQTVWNGIKAVLSAVWDAIKTVVSTAIQNNRIAITAGWNAIKNVTSTVWNAIKAALSAAWNAIKSVVQAGINLARQVVTAGWNAIKAATTAVWNAVRTTLQTAWNNIRAVVQAGINVARQVVTTGWNFIRTTTQTVWNAIRTFLQTAWNAIRTLVQTGITTVRNVIQTGWNFIRTTTSTVWNAIKTFLTSFWNTLRQLFTTSVTTARNIIQTGWNFIRTTTQTVFNAIATFFSGWWTRLRELWNTTLTTIRRLIDTAWTAISTRTREFGTNLYNALTERFTAIRNGVMDRLTNLRNSVSDLWTNMWNRARDFGDNLRNLLADKFAGAVNTVRKYLGLLAKAMASVLSAIGMDELAGSLNSTAGRLNEPVRFAKGGVHEANAYARGGMEIGDSGGVGSGKRIVAITNEAGPEAIVPLKKKTKPGMRALRVAAAAHRLALMPQHQFQRGGEREQTYMIRRPKLLAAGGFTADRIQQTIAWAKRYNGSPYTWGGANPGGTDCSGWMGHVHQHLSGGTPGGRFFGSTHSMTDSNMANWGYRKGTVNPGFNVGVAHGGQGGGHTAGTLAYGSGEINTETGGGAGGTYTGGSAWGAKHSYFGGNIFGLGSPGSISGGGGGGFFSGIVDALGNAWNSVTDFMASTFKPPQIPEVGLGQFGSGIKSYLGSLAGKVKDWLTDKATSVLGIGSGGSSGGGYGGGGPGDYGSLGSAQAAAKFIAKRAQDAGLPPELPVMTSLVESNLMTGAKVRYKDHDSAGPYQVRVGLHNWKLSDAEDYGYSTENWFIKNALRYKGQYGLGAQAFGAWCQRVQGSAYPSRYAERYQDARSILGMRTGGVIPGIEGAKKLFMGHAGERVLPIPAVDAFDRLSNSIVLWSRNASRIGTTMGAASPVPGVVSAGSSQAININISQDFSGITVGSSAGGTSVEEIMEMARRGGEEGARAALQKMTTTRHKVSNRIATRRT